KDTDVPPSGRQQKTPVGPAEPPPAASYEDEADQGGMNVEPPHPPRGWKKMPPAAIPSAKKGPTVLIAATILLLIGLGAVAAVLISPFIKPSEPTNPKENPAEELAWKVDKALEGNDFAGADQLVHQHKHELSDGGQALQAKIDAKRKEFLKDLLARLERDADYHRVLDEVNNNRQKLGDHFAHKLRHQILVLVLTSRTT